MCGDLDEEDRPKGDLYQRFLVHSQAMLGRGPASGDDLNAYLDQLFADLLQKSRIQGSDMRNHIRIFPIFSDCALILRIKLPNHCGSINRHLNSRWRLDVGETHDGADSGSMSTRESKHKLEEQSMKVSYRFLSYVLIVCSFSFAGASLAGKHKNFENRTKERAQA